MRTILVSMITVNLVYYVDLIIYTLHPLTLHFIDLSIYN